MAYLQSKHMRGKVSKASVDYSPGMDDIRCKNCKHFMEPDACEIVAGKIDPEYWCKKFAREKA